MKKILTYSFILIFFLLSCRKEELQRIPQFTKGINFTAVVDPQFSQLNSFDLPNAKIVLTTKSVNADEVEKVDLSTVLVSNGVASAPAIVKSLKSNDLNSTITITAQEFATAFGKSLADLAGGDQFNVRYVATMKNGMVFSDANSSQGVLTSAGTTFTASFSVPVYCPTNIGGVYNTVTNGVDQVKGANHTNVISVVTLNKVNETTYTVDDISAGAFRDFYNSVPAYGAPEKVPFTLKNVCGKLTLPPGSDGWGDVLSGSGTVNDDGTLTIHWVTNSGDDWTSTYTKK